MYYDIEDTRQPPDPISHAQCAICGDIQDLSDMKEVEADVWVCDLRGTDCLQEWKDDHDGMEDDDA